MQQAEFEEKEYEHPLLSQLERGSSLFWPPGQVLEQYLGFDRGLFLTASYLWNLHGMRTPLPGVVPYFDYWPFQPPFHQRRDRLPPFRLNCFVQTKRCEVGQRLPRHLGALGPAGPFYRFVIDEEQQEGLHAAATALSGRALFTYAAPVFSTARRLFFLQRSGHLVENSTFPEVGLLQGHAAWYYNEPGATGVVNQGFERVESLGLRDRVLALVNERRLAGSESASDNIVALSASIRESSRRLGEPDGGARSAYLADDWRDIGRFSEQYEVPRAARAFLEVHAFCVRFAADWLVVDERAT